MLRDLNVLLSTLETKRTELEVLLTNPAQRTQILSRIDSVTSKEGISVLEVQALLTVVEEMVEHFSTNYLDDKGELIKFSVWQMIFDATYRKKIFSTVLFVKDVIIKIIAIFKK